MWGGWDEPGVSLGPRLQSSTLGPHRVVLASDSGSLARGWWPRVGSQSLEARRVFSCTTPCQSGSGRSGGVAAGVRGSRGIQRVHRTCAEQLSPSCEEPLNSVLGLVQSLPASSHQSGVDEDIRRVSTYNQGPIGTACGGWLVLAGPLVIVKDGVSG